LPFETEPKACQQEDADHDEHTADGERGVEVLVELGVDRERQRCVTFCRPRT
jgi:hypothetical protein